MPLPAGVDPYPYQIQLFHMIRKAFRENMRVLAEAPTGSGKSILMSMIVDSFMGINKRSKVDRHLYFVVDEKFLLYQFSDHLTKWGISHDIIGDGHREGRHVNVHVCTIQTLRSLPPERYPALIIIDEAHFSTSKSYMDLFYKFMDSKVLGLTASPETGSGKGLAADLQYDENGILIKDDNGTPINLGNGIFDIMVECPVSMREMTEGIEITDKSGTTQILKTLVPIKYYGVPCKNIETLHMQAGDFKTSEIDKLLKENGTYGDSIKEMEKWPDIKSHILFFQKSVKSCYDMQTILLSHGYTAEVLEGKLSRKERKGVMKRFTSGETQCLITCKMVQKGVDIPYLLMSVDNQPVAGRGTLRQKIGRGTRPAPGKDKFIYLDMVANHRCLPGSDVYSVIEWNFQSKKYNKKPKGDGTEQTCPLCYALIPEGTTTCPECGAEKKIIPKKEKKGKHVDGELVEIVPVPLKDRDPEGRSEIQGKISAALRDNNMDALFEIGREITDSKKLPFWVYHKMTKKKKIVDTTLLYRMKRSGHITSGKVWFMKKWIKRGIMIEEIDGKIRDKESEIDRLRRMLEAEENQLEELQSEKRDWELNWKDKKSS